MAKELFIPCSIDNLRRLQCAISNEIKAIHESPNFRGSRILLKQVRRLAQERQYYREMEIYLLGDFKTEWHADLKVAQDYFYDKDIQLLCYQRLDDSHFKIEGFNNGHHVKIHLIDNKLYYWDVKEFKALDE